MSRVDAVEFNCVWHRLGTWRAAAVSDYLWNQPGYIGGQPSGECIVAHKPKYWSQFIGERLGVPLFFWRRAGYSRRCEMGEFFVRASPRGEQGVANRRSSHIPLSVRKKVGGHDISES